MTATNLYTQAIDNSQQFASQTVAGAEQFIKYVVAPDGIYDVMGGGLYLSPTQKSALPLGLPPYSDPNNPAYALNTPGLISSAFYLGTPIMPWLNLY